MTAVMFTTEDDVSIHRCWRRLQLWIRTAVINITFH